MMFGRETRGCVRVNTVSLGSCSVPMVDILRVRSRVFSSAATGSHVRTSPLTHLWLVEARTVCPTSLSKSTWENLWLRCAVSCGNVSCLVCGHMLGPIIITYQADCALAITTESFITTSVSHSREPFCTVLSAGFPATASVVVSVLLICSRTQQREPTYKQQNLPPQDGCRAVNLVHVCFDGALFVPSTAVFFFFLKAFAKQGARDFSDKDWLRLIHQEAARRDSRTARIPKIPWLTFDQFNDTLVEYN